MADGPNFDRGLRWRVSGLPFQPWRDVYPRLMGASMFVTVAYAFGAYVVTSLVFAALFSLDPGGVAGADGFTELLWFSVQTLSTIGYGGMTPESPFVNVLVIAESFIGLAGVAVITAILYAKFSLPEARVQFSDALAIHDYEGQPTLHIRIVNERTTPVLNVELHVAVLVDESTEGRRFLRLRDLELARNKVPLFGMAFTAMHPLEASSPLRNIDDVDRVRMLLVTVSGTDARTLQPVFARQLYQHHQVKYGVGFADMVTYSDEGMPSLDLTKLDQLVPRELTRAEDSAS